METKMQNNKFSLQSTLKALYVLMEFIPRWKFRFRIEITLFARCLKLNLKSSPKAQQIPQPLAMHSLFRVNKTQSRTVEYCLY